MGKLTEAATRGVLYEKLFLEILQNSQENCFPVNFAKFLRTPFYRTPLVAASVLSFTIEI